MKKPFVYYLYILWILCSAFGPADPTDIQITLAPSATGSITLSVTGAQKTASNIRLEWQILQDGRPGQKGVLPAVLFSPNHSTLVRLPIKLSPGNQETWLR